MTISVMGSEVKNISSGNIAYADSAVRFTVVSDGVIRMEWNPEGEFVDNRSLLAVNREYPQSKFKVKVSDDNLNISTSKVKVTYKLGSGKFNRENLSVVSVNGFFPIDWHPGDKQNGNLKGTTRTLDGLDGDVQTQTWCADMKLGEIRQLEDGLLATDGWTLIDDSEGYVFNDDSDWAWVEDRTPSGGQDWYFMAYGHDYKSALKDFTLFAGKIPLPPRFTFGYWWSRYWAYSDKELRGLVSKFNSYDIPLDVLVVDMDWHYTDEGRGGWTGWTWNKNLFPDPAKFISHLHDNDIKVTINLHPADGFESYEEVYPAMSKALNHKDGGKISWINSDKRMITAAFDNVFHPMEKDGIDFWWLDWQQAINDPVKKRLNNTWWINYCFFSDMERNRDRRPLLYHRWGGLGNHRYQVGFSGDAIISWKSLDYQPYFTATASNVLYGYWSHDIGGHISMGAGIVPEMYTRWLQFGAYSPVMRTHSSKDGRLNKEPWVFDDEYRDVIRETIIGRYRMVPYIYTMARKAHDEGLSLCRPLYYDNPESTEAYSFNRQYMFGDDMLIAPVTVPGVDGYAEMNVWLPDGKWFEIHSGTLLDGGKLYSRDFAIDEYGVYAKAGAVIPMYDDSVRRLGDDGGNRIVLAVVPGDGGSCVMYEDGGNDKDYTTRYATTSVKHESNGKKSSLTILPRVGEYDGMLPSRDFTAKFLSVRTPLRVLVDGKEASWRYNGNDFAVEVDIPATDCSKKKVVEVMFDNADKYVADGIVGKSRRMGKAVNRIKFQGYDTHKDGLASLGSINEAVTYNPARLDELVGMFKREFNDLPGVLSREGVDDEMADRFLKLVNWRKDAE
ncbi:MAG: glycoside hydrolase family 31 protein [Paenibacillus sp.]|nr:glycoside hydrolase family 31 protein [Paenibacillus sp.]